MEAVITKNTTMSTRTPEFFTFAIPRCFHHFPSLPEDLRIANLFFILISWFVMFMLHKHLTRRINYRITQQNRDTIKEAWNNVFKELGSLKKKVGIIEDTHTISGPEARPIHPPSNSKADKVEATEDTQTQQVDALVTITNTLHELNNKVDRVEEGQRETSDELIVSFNKVLETMRESIDAGRALGQRVAELKLEDMAEKREMLNLIIELNQRIESLEDR